MKRLGFGIAAAMMVVVLTSASFANAASIDPDMRKQGMSEAPPVVAAAGLPCTVIDATLDGSDGETNYYEVACKEGLGFVVTAKNKKYVNAFDCLIVSLPGSDGKISNLACKLPANQQLKTALQPLATKSGAACTVTNNRYLGSSANDNLYEVACTEGGGYILDVPRGYAATPKATDCMQYGVTGSMTCTLTPRDQQFVKVDKIAAASGKACSIKDRRVVGSAPDGSTYYEFACTDGSGFMAKSDPTGKFAQAIDCGEASGIAGGCTLSDASRAKAALLAHYASMAKAAGFDCAISDAAPFPSRDPATSIAELSCSNRDDGGIGFFPTGAAGSPRVLNCLRASAEGYQCSLTATAPLYPQISAQLKAKGHGSCVVSNARSVGSTAAGAVGSNDLIEVACADGGAGLVLEYDYGSQIPSDILNCAQAKSYGGCKLPRQKAG